MNDKFQPIVSRLVDLSYNALIRRWAIRIGGGLAGFWLLITVLGLEFLTSTTFYPEVEATYGIFSVEGSPAKQVCRYWSGTGYRDVTFTFLFETCPVYRWKRQFAD